MPKAYFTCHSCGNRTEYSREGQRCDVLSGWLTVSRWKGPGAVEHYDFCSFACLERWAEAQVPKIPEVFRKAFKEGEDKQ